MISHNFIAQFIILCQRTQNPFCDEDPLRETTCWGTFCRKSSGLWGSWLKLIGANTTCVALGNVSAPIFIHAIVLTNGIVPQASTQPAAPKITPFPTFCVWLFSVFWDSISFTQGTCGEVKGCSFILVSIPNTTIFPVLIITWRSMCGGCMATLLLFLTLLTYPYVFPLIYHFSSWWKTLPWFAFFYNSTSFSDSWLFITLMLPRSSAWPVDVLGLSLITDVAAVCTGYWSPE